MVVKWCSSISRGSGLHDKTKELFFSFASFTERFDEYQFLFLTQGTWQRGIGENREVKWKNMTVEMAPKSTVS